MAVTDLFGVSLFSPRTNQDVNNARTSYSNQSTSSYAPVSTYTDARQLTLILSSPGASSSSKKADSVSAMSSPNTTPALTSSPNLAGSSGAEASTGQAPSLLGGIFGNGSNTFLIVAIIAGAVVLSSRGGK